LPPLGGLAGEIWPPRPAEALNWRPIEGAEDHATNSLAALATHIAGAEQYWTTQIIGGQAVSRDRPAEFTTQVPGAASLVQRLSEVGAESRTILTGLTASDLDGSREAGERTVPVRWAILHVIDHTALHLGHMQLTYQLWMSGQSGPSPRWYERLSPSG
jgi:uncharacterized damage-inducible protein DinB